MPLVISNNVSVTQGERWTNVDRGIASRKKDSSEQKPASGPASNEVDVGNAAKRLREINYAFKAIGTDAEGPTDLTSREAEANRAEDLALYTKNLIERQPSIALLSQATELSAQALSLLGG
jgi:hypothetical protein